MMDLAYRFNERTYLLTVEMGNGCFLVTIDGHMYRVNAEEVRPGFFNVLFRGHQHKVIVSHEGERRMIFTDGEVYQLTRTEGRMDRPPEEKGGDLSSPMAAKVVKVMVDQGQHVERGQTLVVLEAMKMEYEIKAPRSGTIEKLHCREGEQIEAGRIVADITEDTREEEQ